MKFFLNFRVFLCFFFFCNEKSLLVLLRNVLANILLYLLLINSSKFDKKDMLGKGIGGDIGGDIGYILVNAWG